MIRRVLILVAGAIAACSVIGVWVARKIDEAVRFPTQGTPR